MMLEHLGEKQAARAVEEAIFKVLAASSVRTRDIGGNATTRDMGEVIAAEVSARLPTHRNLPLLGVEHAIVVPQTQGIRSTLKTNLKVVSKGYRFSSLHNPVDELWASAKQASDLFPAGSLLDLPRSTQ